MDKLKRNKGFTLLEMLVCIVTLLLIAGIVSIGSDFALRSYNASLFESNSQMLESTLNLYLSDMLRHASVAEEDDLDDINWLDEIWEDIDTDSIEDKENLKLVNGFTNVEYQIYGGDIKIFNKIEDDERTFLVYETKRNPGVMIVEEGMYAETLYISDFVLIYNTEKHYFTGYYKIKSTILEDAERNCTFTCRTIAEY